MGCLNGFVAGVGDSIGVFDLYAVTSVLEWGANGGAFEHGENEVDLGDLIEGNGGVVVVTQGELDAGSAVGRNFDILNANVEVGIF